MVLYLNLTAGVNVGSLPLDSTMLQRLPSIMRIIYIELLIPSASLTLKMATVLYARMLEHIVLNSRNENHTTVVTVVEVLVMGEKN
jgi:hypothetical protein